MIQFKIFRKPIEVIEVDINLWLQENKNFEIEAWENKIIVGTETTTSSGIRCVFTVQYSIKTDAKHVGFQPQVHVQL